MTNNGCPVRHPLFRLLYRFVIYYHFLTLLHTCKVAELPKKSQSFIWSWSDQIPVIKTGR